MKAYTLKIIDPITNIELLKITEENGYQIEANITNVALSDADSLNVINIYNANSLFDPKILQDKLLIFEVGLKSNGLAKLHGYDLNKLSIKPILRGYVYDIINDFSTIPNPKTIIRTAAFPRNKLNINNEKTIVIFKKNDNFYNFVNDVAKTYCNINIEASVESIKHIVNKIQDIVFEFDSRDIQVLSQLSNFITTTSKTLNSNVPIILSTNQTGFVLTYDYRSTTVKELKKELTEALSKPEYTIDTSMILKAPSITEVNKLQLQTVLLPSIKVGSIINIDNPKLAFSSSNLDARINEQGKIVNSIKGIYFVSGINHSISYFSSSPLAYSSLIELIKV